MIVKNNKWEISFKLLSSPKKAVSLFREVPYNQRGAVLLGLSKGMQEKILSKLKTEEVLNMFHYLDPEEITDLLQNVDDSKRKVIVDNLRPDMKKKVEFLIKFNPKTAAGIMSLDYASVNYDAKFKDVLDVIHNYEKRTGKFPTILVVKNNHLMGELPGYVFALKKKDDRIRKYVEELPSVRHDKNEKTVIRRFKRHPANKLVVVDNDKSIMGVIYSDDVLKLMNRQSAKELYKSAGVSEEENVHDTAYNKVKYRYKWLILNLATAFLAASVVGLFKDTISSFVLLAAYMPVVAGMGGNAATQTLAVVVRGLALKNIELETARKVVFNEVIAGAVNGLINGVIVAFIAYIFNQNLLLGVITGLAIMVNLMIAGFFGATVPLVMKKLRKDPATSATIFITTATDVFGFLAFLGLATLLL